MLTIDHSLAHWFRERLDGLFPDIMWVFSAPGSAPMVAAVLIVTALLLVWRKRWHLLAALMLTVPIGSLMGEGLKQVFQRARPFEGGPFGEWGGYSFPSGHTNAATLLYVFLASAILPLFERRRWRLMVIGATATLVLGVALSRVALGAHYLTDVLAGMTLGLTWAALCANRVSAWRSRMDDDDVPQAVAVEAGVAETEIGRNPGQTA